MLTETEVLETLGHIHQKQLRIWVREKWLRPVMVEGDICFSDADMARLHLLDFLSNDLAIDTEAIPIILSLIDQVHDIRRQMHRLGAAINEQPDPVRLQILDCVCQSRSADRN